MVRNYKRTSNRGDYGKEKLQMAIDAVSSESLSIYSAAKFYGIPQSTLRLKVTGWAGRPATKDNPAIGGVSTTISSLEEERISNLLKTMNRWGFGLSKNQVLDSIQEYVIKNNIANHFKNNRPGHDWFRDFCNRNRLSLKKAELLESSRARQSNDPFIVYSFFDLLEDVIKELGLENKPDSIYNCDESGFKSDAVTTKIVAGTGETAQRVSHGNGRHQTTVLTCVAASGRKLPPFILHTGKRIQSTFFGPNEYPGTSYFANESGWMDCAVFSNWFSNHFLRYVDGPSLLIYDGHNSHISIQVIQEAIDHNVTLLRLSPHTTHILQPLDVSIFKGMKTRHDVLLHESCRHRLSKMLPKSDFSDILGKAWSEVKTEVIVRGFEACGIYPLNRSAINESRMDPNKLKRYHSAKQHQQQQQTLTENQNSEPQVIIINIDNPVAAVAPSTTTPPPLAISQVPNTTGDEMSPREIIQGEKIIKVDVILNFDCDSQENLPQFILGNFKTNNISQVPTQIDGNNSSNIRNNSPNSPVSMTTASESDGTSFESILLKTVIPEPSSVPKKRKRVDVATVCTTPEYLDFIKAQEENKKKKQSKSNNGGRKQKQKPATKTKTNVAKKRGRPKKSST